MIRAVRLACRFNFTIEPKTEEAIRFHARELFPAVAIERICQELTKGHAFQKLPEMLLQLHAYGLLGSIFPTLVDVSFSEIEKRLEPTKSYPPDAPVIAFLLPLFPEFTLHDEIELCKKLKLPTADQQFVTFFSHVKKLVKKEADKWTWAHAYANPLADLCLNLLFVSAKHQPRKNELKDAIQRIKDKNPVVKSSNLLQAGIVPGKEMGALLKEAEKIAINENITDPQEILKLLKRSPYWP